MDDRSRLAVDEPARQRVYPIWGNDEGQLVNGFALPVDNSVDAVARQRTANRPALGKTGLVVVGASLTL
jgi:hypothetical protein